MSLDPYAGFKREWKKQEKQPWTYVKLPKETAMWLLLKCGRLEIENLSLRAQLSLAHTALRFKRTLADWIGWP